MLGAVGDVLWDYSLCLSFGGTGLYAFLLEMIVGYRSLGEITLHFIGPCQAESARRLPYMRQPEHLRELI